LVVVGDVDPAATEAGIYETWGAWRSTDTGEPISIAAASPPSGRVLIEAARPDDAYADLTIECRLPAAAGIQSAARDVARVLLQRRLQDALRVREGATYDVQV